ncbi:M23 family metallopeptidase [Rickettsiales bacterium LUAb2]
MLLNLIRQNTIKYVVKFINIEIENIIKILKIDIKISAQYIYNRLLIRLKLLFIWSINNYLKAIFVYSIIVIAIINTSLFYNNYALFTNLANNWQYSISVANTPYVVTTIINRLKYNGVKRYQHQDIEISTLNELNNSLTSYNIDKTQINSVIKLVKTKYNFKKLKNPVTANITLSFIKKQNYTSLLRLDLPINNNYTLAIIADSNNDNTFTAKVEQTTVYTYIVKKDFIINNNNYYASANNSTIPKNIIGEVNNVLAWHIDFQREFSSGNIVNVLYQCYYTNNNQEKPTCNNLLYISAKLNERFISIYKYNSKYYLSDGKSAATTLLRTPIDGARISSTFGKRVDPILGYTAFHKGIDFAAPTGTPIPAAGDGVVVKIVVSNSYGKYVEVRHNAYLSTIYAHMNAFAKGLHIGEAVKQRDIVGYVGATGWATGPHLHYEIHFNGNAVNPMFVRLPSTVTLKNDDLKQFLTIKNQIDTLFIKTPFNKAIFINSDILNTAKNKDNTSKTKS